MDTTSFVALPLLCQCRVLQFCAPRDIRNARLTCRAFRDASARVRWKVRHVRTKQQYEALTPAELGNMHTLYMSGCTDITDVSALAGIHTLDIRWCTAVKDVNALAGIHTLYMSDCTAVKNVSALAGIDELWIRGCTAVTDVSALVGIRVLCVRRNQLDALQLDALRVAGCEIWQSW